MKLVLFLALIAIAAKAQVPDTDTAKQLSFKLVNSVPRCFGPDTVDSTSGQSACSYTLPTGVCKLGAKGKGSFVLIEKMNKTTGKSDLLLKVSLTGLENCNGLDLVPKIALRKAHSNCSSGSCVNMDVSESALLEPQFNCHVLDGRCKFQTFLSESSSSPYYSNDSNAIYSNISCNMTEWPLNQSRLSCGISL